MRRMFWSGLLVIALVIAFVLPAFAGSVPLSVEPTSLELKGAPSTELKANLRLSVLEEEVNLSAGALDFTCLDEKNQPLPALSASQIGFTPAFIEKLAAGSSTQVAVSIILPEKTGTCTGSLYFDLGYPVKYRATVPVSLEIATTPILAIQSPEKMTISGWNHPTVYSQPFTLKETVGGSPITNLSVEVGQFTSAEWKSLPDEGVVTTELAATTLLGGGTLTGLLKFNLLKAPAGSYEGQVYFKSAGKLLATLPVTLNVRHPWWPAAGVLAVGVALGLWLSFYKVSGRLRDQLIKQIADVKKQRDTDPEFIEYFGPAVDPLIQGAETLLSQKKYSDGITRITDAEKLAAKWTDFNRLEWIAQLDYLKNDLLPRLVSETAPFGVNLLNQAKELLKGAANKDSPVAIQTAVKKIEDLLASWKTLQVRLDAISSAIQQLPAGSDKNDCLLEEKDLRLRHSDLPLDESHVTWSLLDGDIQKLLQKVTHFSKTLKTPLAHLLGASWNLPPMVLAGTPPKLAYSQPVTEKQGKAAQRRLTFWTVFAYALGGILLAVAGYAALYQASLTFGAHPVTDYAGLLVWGFTGQAGFTTIADLVRGLGLPAFLKAG